MDTIGARFSRPEPRRRARDFVAGLLAPLPVKNCWTIAEHAGDDGPGGMQDLIGRAVWDDAAVRADVREFVAARLGHPDGILVVDETGDLKKGVHTVGVQRQYSGTAVAQHQHRRWRAWHRWTTLVIAAHAFLAAATTLSTKSPDGLIAITVNELRRLFHALVIDPVRRVADVIAWSIYRRRHQNQANASHYARQALSEP